MTMLLRRRTISLRIKPSTPIARHCKWNDFPCPYGRGCSIEGDRNRLRLFPELQSEWHLRCLPKPFAESNWGNIECTETRYQLFLRFCRVCVLFLLILLMLRRRPIDHWDGERPLCNRRWSDGRWRPWRERCFWKLSWKRKFSIFHVRHVRLTPSISATVIIFRSFSWLVYLYIVGLSEDHHYRDTSLDAPEKS